MNQNSEETMTRKSPANLTTPLQVLGAILAAGVVVVGVQLDLSSRLFAILPGVLMVIFAASAVLIPFRSSSPPVSRASSFGLILPGAWTRIVLLPIMNPIGRVRLAVRDLEVRRLVNSAGRTQVLLLVADHRSCYLPGSGSPDKPSPFFDSMAEWLKARGARVTPVEELAP